MTQAEVASLFRRRGDILEPTEWTRSPWDHGSLHGSAICGALGWLLERTCPHPDLWLTRLSVEIWSMIPLAPLETAARIVKPGRRTCVIEATLSHAGRTVARATSQWTRRVSAEAALESPGPRPPELPCTANDPGATPDMDYPRPGFNCDAIELRSIEGTTEDPGPGRIWVSLRHPVVEGEDTSALLRIVTLSDVGIAVGWDESPHGQGLINPDVTVLLNRYPAGEWVLFDSRIHASGIGLGFCETILSDDGGPFGRVLQSLVETSITF